jgi:hypothetical protein
MGISILRHPKIVCCGSGEINATVFGVLALLDAFRITNLRWRISTFALAVKN